MKQSNVKLYVDCMIAEIMLSDNILHKKASVISNIKDTISNYFESHIDPDDKTGSFLNFIVPGTLSMLIGGWLGPTLGLAMRVLNIDIASILSSVYDGVKSLVSGNNTIDSNQIDNVVQAAIQPHAGGEDLQGLAAIQDAKFLKMAVVNYHNQSISENNLKIIFAAPGRRGKALGTIGRLLGWIIKTAAVSAGLMVAGDVANKMLGRPNAFDKTIEKGKPIVQTETPSVTSKQTKFPVKSGYNNIQYNGSTNWIEKYPNTDSGIKNMLIAFTKDVYDGLNGLETIIMSSPLFKTTVDNIAWYNHASAGDPIIFIPKHFTSKKELVDHFIDDVASRAGNTTPTPNQTSPFSGLPRSTLA